MRCPSCNSLDTQVKDSRPTEDSAAIRRRRLCLACGFRFTTFERVQLRELDDVAYVRFASVYRNFREAKDFETLLGELSGEDDSKPPAAARK